MNHTTIRTIVKLPGVPAARRRYLIELGIYELQEARTRFRKAGAVNAHAATVRALKSAQGALRHAQRLENPDIPPNRTIRKACPRRNLTP